MGCILDSYRHLIPDNNCSKTPDPCSICVDSYCRFITHISSIADVNNRSIHTYRYPAIMKRNWQCNLSLRAGSSMIYPLFNIQLRSNLVSTAQLYHHYNFSRKAHNNQLLFLHSIDMPSQHPSLGDLLLLSSFYC